MPHPLLFEKPLPATFVSLPGPSAAALFNSGLSQLAERPFGPSVLSMNRPGR